MARTLLDLFKGSPQDLAVQPDTETFIEQETTGLRVKSAVELNNPLIYGNEAGRIMLRTTPSKDLMLESMKPEGAPDSPTGLIGIGLSTLTGGKVDSLANVRNIINDTLGIPQPLIPTRVYNYMDENPQLTVQDILDKKQGTEFGKFLKQTGGGTPKTIVNQAIGNAITLGKDKLRDTLFGKPPTINEIAGIKEGDTTEYKFDNTYTKVQTELRYTEPKSPDNLLIETWETKRVNLATVSPIYGVQRGSYLWNSKLGETIQKRNEVFPGGLSQYSPNHRYVNFDDKSNQSPISKKSLENKYGLSSKVDAINLSGGDKDIRTTQELEDTDLVPFWIGDVGSDKKTHFRTIITGMTETVTPSWNTHNFFGNPFSFYTYSSIERSVSFTLQIYCSSPTELLMNWKRVNSLTKYTYPTIKTHERGRYSDPPIIDFRIGDIYNRKTGFIDSLSYTYPDNGGWETDPEIGLLPKFIEISITIKFIETDDIKYYYDYEKDEKSISAVNEENGSSNFSGESVNGERNAVGLGKLDSKGLTPLKNSSPKSMTSINGIKSETPHESQNKTDSTSLSDPKIPNQDDNKSIIQSINEAQSSLQLTKEQSEMWITSLKTDGYVQKKNTSGLNLKPGEVAYTRPDSPDILVLNIDGDSRIIHQEPSISNNSLGSLIGN